jgi:hypothetical protein
MACAMASSDPEKFGSPFIDSSKLIVLTWVVAFISYRLAASSTTAAGLPHRGAISSSLLMGATPSVLHLIFATLVGMMAVELIYNGFAGRI